MAALGRSSFFEESKRKNLSEKKEAILNIALKDEDWRVRCTAVAVIPKIYLYQNVDQNKIVALLSRALNDENFQVRRSAIQAVPHPIQGPDQLTPVLLNFLKDKNADIRLDAALKLLKLGHTSELAETILLQALQHHQDSRYRLDALDALQYSRSELAASAISQALKDQSVEVRGGSASALINIMRDREAAVQALINAAPRQQ